MFCLVLTCLGYDLRGLGVEALEEPKSLVLVTMAEHAYTYPWKQMFPEAKLTS